MKYESGDCVYYIDTNNKIIFAEIYKVIESICAYDVVELKDYKFRTVHQDDCFEEEKHAKAVLKQRKKGGKDVNKKRNQKTD
jgi:NAD-dependent dihydropyrimidine dehydrogenase PreA subunit